MPPHVEYAPLSASDAALLDVLTGDDFPSVRPFGLAPAVGKQPDPLPAQRKQAPLQSTPRSPTTAKEMPPRTLARRDDALDPLLLAAAFASGPDVTRNHYAHDFFPGVQLPSSEGSYDWKKFSGVDSAKLRDSEAPRKLRYESRQMPRRERLALDKQQAAASDSGKENDDAGMVPSSPSKARRTSSTTKPQLPGPQGNRGKRGPDATNAPTPGTLSIPATAPTAGTSVLHDVPTPTLPPAHALEVKCMARTRIPTPYGPVFLHLYHNNRDNKEHLAIVVDEIQQQDEEPPADGPLPIRSRTLDACWGANETEMDRLIRGAYVGKLGPTKQKASAPPPEGSQRQPRPPSCMSPSCLPLIRIHSECFTGETIGSMRCDCGEQLAEALRQISQSETKRGVVVYLRQEGRGIGLLNKIKAYNLQDMGADTVRANELLGFGADERGYEVVGGILRDLGLAPESEGDQEKGVRLLTNNPDKVAALEKEGVKVVERVSMVPRSWQASLSASELHAGSAGSHLQLPAHVYGGNHFVGTPGGILGASTPYGPDLEKYLRTKVERMGHILPKVWEPRESVQS